MAAKKNKTAGAQAGRWTRKAQDPRGAYHLPAGRPIPRVPVHRPRRVPGRR
jgi:hypothetical protein